MKVKLFILLSCFHFCSKNLSGQDAYVLKKSGEEFLSAQKYNLALDAFLKYRQAYPGDATTVQNIGICFFHLNNLDAAENFLYQALNTKARPPAQVFLYLGKLHHAKLEFEQAAVFYKKFLQKNSASPSLRAAVTDDIRRCGAGIRISRLSPAAAVIHLGNIVNSAGDDFKPILSPGGSKRLYFSSSRTGNTGCNSDDCKADMFFTDLTDGDWDTPRQLSVFLTSIQHEVALDFDQSGSHLYFFRGETLFSGEILVDTFRENIIERTLFSPAFEGPMRPWEGDRAPFFFNDTVLLFASRREGSFGGLDLYFSTFSNGAWSIPQNLGPTINTPYDETSPFLSNDGRTLYFSSNAARRSMGGLDIFKSTYLDHTQRWSPPENLGIPINSAGNDEQFSMTHDGSEAFFASSRKQGLGERDLFVALFDPPRPEQMRRSLPVSFHEVPAYQAALEGATESTGQTAASFFEDITSFELPVFPSPEPGQPLPEEGLAALEFLAALMKQHPEVKISIAVHTDQTDDVAAVCENAFRRSAAFLRQEGASVDNLVFRCAGPSWPVASNQPEKNRRIEIFINNPESLPFEVHTPAIDPGALDARFFQKAMTSLCYQVVIDLDSLMLEGELEKLQRFYPKSILEERTSQSETLFALGFYLTFASAEEWRKKLERDGYREARIAAYLNSWEISKTEAAQFVEQFPDLKNFIKN